MVDDDKVTVADLLASPVRPAGTWDAADEEAREFLRREARQEVERWEPVANEWNGKIVWTFRRKLEQ